MAQLTVFMVIFFVILYFRDYTDSYEKALHYVELDEADLVLQIPASFEKHLVKEEKATLFMALNAINGVKASLGGAYLQRIIRDFNREIMVEWLQPPRMNTQPTIDVAAINWFNLMLMMPHGVWTYSLLINKIF